jgi:hypothetical protein
MPVYPADPSPRPVLACGTTLLASDYTGAALVAENGAAGAATINFVGQDIDRSALDAHIGADYGRVTTLYGQVGGINATRAAANALKIRHLTLGKRRALIAEGGSSSGDGIPTGTVYSADTASLGGVGPTAKDYTYMAMVHPSSAAHCNQLGAPGLHTGTLLHLTASNGDPVLQLYSDGIGDETTGGRWAVGDGASFTFAPTESFVRTTPGVLTVTSGTDGVRIWWDEELQAIASRSALVRTAGASYLGRLSTSLAGATSRAFEGRIGADMLWNVVLSPAEAAIRRGILYELFGHDPSRSRYKARFLAVVGDSNAAGYKCLGRNGWEKQLQALMPDVGFANFAVEGSTVLQNPAQPLSYAHTIGLFPGWVARSLAQAKGDCGLIISSVGNDFGISPQPTASDVFNGQLAVVALARAANPNVKIFICTGTLHNAESYTSLQTATNTLIRNGAGANDYTVIDFAANATLSTYPGSAFSGPNHLSETGHTIAAGIANTSIRAKFGWV